MSPSRAPAAAAGAGLRAGALGPESPPGASHCDGREGPSRSRSLWVLVTARARARVPVIPGPARGPWFRLGRLCAQRRATAGAKKACPAGAAPPLLQYDAASWDERARDR